MNMPRFSAEASLYKTSGHYRTGRQAINSRTKMIGPIHLAVINDPGPGETVVIVDKWPPDPWDPLEPWTWLNTALGPARLGWVGAELGAKLGAELGAQTRCRRRNRGSRRRRRRTTIRKKRAPNAAAETSPTTVKAL